MKNSILALAAFALDTYTHVIDKMQQEAAGKMGGFMEMVMWRAQKERAAAVAAAPVILTLLCCKTRQNLL